MSQQEQKQKHQQNRYLVSSIIWLMSATTIIYNTPQTLAFTPPRISHHHTPHTHSLHSTIPTTTTTTTTPPSSTEKEITIPSSTSSDNAFTTLAQLSTITLLKSDLQRDAVGKESGTQAASATNWIDEESSFMLKQALNKLYLKLPNQRTGLDRDISSTWIRWMKSTPTPLLIDLTSSFLPLINSTLTSKHLSYIDSTRNGFLNRIGCRLLLFPSGTKLANPIEEPNGAIIFGKLLYGGVKRFRLLESSTSSRPPRRAGEKLATKSSFKENVECWIQFGGLSRMYEAVDMGSAAVLELVLLPQGQKMGSILEVVKGDDGGEGRRDMALNQLLWHPTKMFDFQSADGMDDDTTEEESMEGMTNTPSTLSGKERNEAFASDFKCAVGGLQLQIDSIVRRVLDGRIIRPAEEVDAARARAKLRGEGKEEVDTEDEEGDSTAMELSLASMEAEELALLGLSPVRGLLLYGPPGCGKTALAREISRALHARSPKIVSAPELLDRWVGGSEKLVRSLFAEAEAELSSCSGDATKSALHVVVIDEIDAVFRKRTSAEDSGEATRSSAVNQILAKLDGVNAIPNVLLIGMTNRRELLDEALLRPGRLEVQIEIPLPDREGRREILGIHFDALRRGGRLSRRLCCAIDGVADFEEEDITNDAMVEEGEEEEVNKDANDDNQDITESSSSPPLSTKGRKRRALKRAAKKILTSLPSVGSRSVYDLAADSNTGGFSGADIAGLVRCAGSIALSRARKDGGGVEGLLITLEDVKQALEEVKR